MVVTINSSKNNNHSSNQLIKKEDQFMKLKNIIVACICLMYTLTSYGQIPPKPNPPVAITDIANVIDDDIQQKYEAALTELERTTSIAVVVVTVPSMGDEYASIDDYANKLFNTWEIGHKGSDNGVLLIFSMEGHDIRIEVGYGLEPFLTDGTSGQLIDNNIIPYFQAGDMRKGFEEGISALMDYVKTQIPNEEQREMIKKQKQKEEQEAQARTEELIQNLLYFLIIAAIFGLLIFLYIQAKKAERIKKMKQEARKLAQEVEKQINSIEPALEAAEEKYAGYPHWAQREAKSYKNEISKLIGEMRKELKGAFDSIEQAPEQSINLMNLIHQRYQQAESVYTKSVSKLPEKIKFYEDQCQAKKQETGTELQQLGDRIDQLKKENYRVFDDDHEVYLALMQEYAALSEIEEPKNLYDSSANLLERVRKQAESVEKELQVRFTNQKRIEELRKRNNENVPAAIQLATSALGYLTQHSIKDVWNILKGDMTRAQQGIANIEDTLKQAEEYNSMDNQRFAEGQSLLDSIEQALDVNLALMANVVTKKTAWEAAVQNLPPLAHQAQLAVEKALNKIKDSDVGNTARSMAKGAAADLQTALTLANLIDRFTMLTQIVTKANEAYKKAQKDIDDAEEAREAARQAAILEAQRAAARRRAAASSSSSGWSSGGSSGGFGGFGGGHSGGGGASRKW